MRIRSRTTLQWLPCILIVMLLGCRPEYQVGQQTADQARLPQIDNLDDYLVTSLGINSRGGQVFCACEPLLAGESIGSSLYLWVLCEEYYVEQGELESGSGLSLPVELQLAEDDGQPRIIGHRVPRDGAYYGPDVRDLFPRSCWREIMPQSRLGRERYNQRASRLAETCEQQAETHLQVD